MPQKLDIPRKTVYRLSIYLRCLHRLKDNEIETVSSDALAAAAGVKSAQLRKDLSLFGNFGTRGLGYNVELLAERIHQELGTSRLQPVILVGVGNLGSALMRYGGFNREGFEILSAFDADVTRVKATNPPVPVRDISEAVEFVKEHGVKLAILAVPAQAAQAIVNDLTAAGVQAILNFAPVILHVPEDVTVHNVDLAAELENLSYFIR